MEPGEPRSTEDILSEQRKHERLLWLGCALIALAVIVPLAIFIAWYAQNVMTCTPPMCF